MMNTTGLRLFSAWLLLWLLGGPPGAALAADGFFPDGKAPTEQEVQEWVDRVKNYRETLVPGEAGRFSAVRLDGSSMFLLDTRKGHLWIWTYGEKGSFTTYQGQLVPGLKMGDVVGASPGLLGSKNVKTGK